MTIFFILLAIILFVVIIVSIRIYLGFKPPLNVEKGTPADCGLEYQQISIATRKNKKLFGWFIPSTTGNPNRASTLIMVHGWGGNAEFALPLALPFKDHNINILMFDHRNHGKSDKDRISTIGTMSEDVGAAIDWVKDNHPKSEKIAVIGHSIGGAAVLHQATQRHDIAAVLSLSTFAHIKKIVAGFLHRFGVMKNHLPTAIKVIERIIGHSLDDMAPVNTIQKLNCPALIMHGTADDTIPYADFEEICKTAIDNAVPNISCLSLEGGEHFPVEEVTAKAKEIITFLSNHNIL